MLHQSWRQGFSLALLAVVILLAGCDLATPQSTFDPHGPMAAIKLDLFWLTFWLAMLVLLGVFGILFYSIYRFRVKDDRLPDELPHQTHGNIRLEIGWTILPVILITIIAIPTVRGIFATETRLVDEDALQITVVGYQWWWAFEYPDLGIVTANEAHIPVGRNVNFSLRSGDVIHAFWVPKLSGKRDLIPNQDNQLWFSADVPDVYYGQCAEYCLGAHAQMRFRVIAQSEEDFDAWVAGFQQAETAQPPMDALAEQGSQLFLQRGCVQCHRIAGTVAQGIIGPDLTNYGQRLTLAAGVYDNNPENLAAWLRDPQALKPENLMPNLNLTEEDINALVAYLFSLGSSEPMQQMTGGQ